MTVIIIQHPDGRIESVHRTVTGAAHAIAGHGIAPTLQGHAHFSIDALTAALAEGRATVSFSDQPDLRVERHFAAV